ncbi:MAG: glycosyltransferase, partial [Acidimicrobiia bacterium]|nr:glycosyltransferase [Acidimicrobiia bacterium]
MPELDRLSVVLPVLNERENLAELIPELCDVLGVIVTHFEILVVDDSSTDGTDALLAELSSRDRRVRYISRVGKAASLPKSISEGVDAAVYDHVAWMDADGSMPPAAFRELIASYRSCSDADSITVGSRFVKGGGFKGVET